ncbi:hypothetical protein ANANG_G00133910 [Anguilla anguilla]|uniref:Uncharacterized protein n=1 Tax=Anguilla anguilla TaxID=7936 RepID=A0A9D3RVV7_ANGAN|nr:hypothetical protein ANANG_G00133910 [Anguilla anguilla]
MDVKERRPYCSLTKTRRDGERATRAPRATWWTARTAACPPRSPTAPARRSRPSTMTPPASCMSTG